MRYFILSLIILVAVFGLHWATVEISPDRSVETGIHREGASTDATKIQAEEDMSSHESQRNRNNNVPRHE